MEICCYSKANLNFIHLKNDIGFELVITNLGASIYQIKFHGKDMVLTTINVSDFKKDAVFYGKTIGRVAGRYKDGILDLNGKKYILSTNELKNTLHGGKHGLSTKIFDCELHKLLDGMEVIYSYLSPDLESGFPGNVKFKIIYHFYEKKSEFDIEFLAKSDADTPINLTNHSYFNLGADSIDQLELKMNASQYIDVDDTLCPIKIQNCEPCRDFKTRKYVVKDIEDSILKKTDGYDNYFVFDHPNKENKVYLWSKEFEMIITTDFIGTQIYSDNFNNQALTTSSSLSRRRSVAIEPSDSHLSNRILKKNELYNRYIKYSFFKKE